MKRTKANVEIATRIVNYALEVDVTEKEFDELVTLCLEIGSESFLKSVAVRNANRKYYGKR